MVVPGPRDLRIFIPEAQSTDWPYRQSGGRVAVELSGGGQRRMHRLVEGGAVGRPTTSRRGYDCQKGEQRRRTA